MRREVLLALDSELAQTNRGGTVGWIFVWWFRASKNGLQTARPAAGAGTEKVPMWPRGDILERSVEFLEIDTDRGAA